MGMNMKGKLCMISERIYKNGIPKLKAYSRINAKGSLTVEAAIVLPVFLCVIISVMFFIKVVHTHEVVQYALDKTAGEIAVFSYIFHASGLKEIDDSVEEGIETASGKIIDGMFQAFGAIQGLDLSMDGANGFAGNLAGYLKDIAAAKAKGGYGDAKTQVFIPLVKLYMKQYLLTGTARDINKRLRDLSVAGGYDGMDFSFSGFFEDERDSIDLVVRYEMNIALPIKILPKIIIFQRAASRAWLGGDGADEIPKDGEDIWTLDNFQRGRKLRALYGGNLPFNFPVIAAFDTAGTATMIKSMDLTAKTYQNASKVAEVAGGYINELAAFRGQDEPWGGKGIVVREGDIKLRQLLLVVPGNPIAPEIEAALESCRQKAEAKGVKLRIERYGFKKTAEEHDDETMKQR